MLVLTLALCLLSFRVSTANELERDRFLLLDSRIIENTENAEITVGKVQKHKANPLFEEDKPWEKRFDNLYANVLYDEEEKIYKCWYSPFIKDLSSKGLTIEERYQKEYHPRGREMAICYATSKDGIKWTKPEMGLVEYEGSKANNILWRGGEALPMGDGDHWNGPHGTGIFKDLRDPDPKRRYKALLKTDILSVAFSPDGIHWDGAIACPEADSAGDTHNNAFWAPTLGKYVGITREWGEPNGRQVAWTTSEDFINWKKVEIVLEGLNPRYQTYSMPVFFHGGIYLGLVAIHDQEDDRVWTELTWSPDTKKWNRVSPGTPLIPNSPGKEGEYDWGCVYTAACPVFLEDEIRLYYGASDGHHNIWRNGFLCMASLRPDGFAGYTQANSEKASTITSTQVMYDDRKLRISADVESSGYVKVRVLDGRDKLLAESKPLKGNLTDEKVEWLDEGKIKNLDKKSIKIQLEFEDAIVYSFSFAK
jgi:hypothetical protein